MAERFEAKEGATDGYDCRDTSAEMKEIEAMLLDMRHAPPEVDTAFLGRVLADAEAEQERQKAVAAAPQRTGRGAAGGLATLFERLGSSWRGRFGIAGGLVTAGVAGVWIGLMAPGLSSELSGGLVSATSYDSLTVLPAYSGFGASILGEEN